MNDVSGFGARVILAASTTFPSGIVLSQFSDDTDPFDIPSQPIATATMGLNGDLIVASSATPSIITIGVIPNSEDDYNLSALFESNKVGRGKVSARDLITITVVYPDGGNLIYSNGVITDGMSGSGIASAGRLKTKTYSFAFESVARA